MNQNILLNIVHLYADKYGWTKDYILNNVFLDEHILHEKIIKQQKQQDLNIQTNLTMLPLAKDEDRKELIENLQNMFIDSNELLRNQKLNEVDENVTLEETKRQIEEAKRIMANL